MTPEEKKIREDERNKIADAIDRRVFVEPRHQRGLWAEIAALVRENRL